MMRVAKDSSKMSSYEELRMYESFSFSVQILQNALIKKLKRG